MLKSITTFFLFAVAVATAQMPLPPPHMAMPEPSAIPEFAICAAAIGIVAWRLRK